MTETWREATNRILAKQQVDNICQLLDGKVEYVTIVNSRGEVKKRIVITYEEKEVTPSS
tara:strand:+ start:974 stop:1150 length:177 start_codon:yes stop_codon:yes gene_type:complete